MQWFGSRIPRYLFAAALYLSQVTRSHASDAVPVPQFDAVSIRETHESGREGSSSRPNPDSFQAVNCDLEFLVQLAFNVAPSSIFNIPPNLKNKHFDIVARMDGESPLVPREQLRSTEAQKLLQARLQALLRKRFSLMVHTENRREPILRLVVAKGGSKLKPSALKAGNSTTTWGFMMLQATDMDTLASVLSTELLTTVTNETNLPGQFAFQVRWDTQDAFDAPTYPFPTLNAALQEQSGLQLKPGRAMVPVMVIDQASLPTEN